MRSVSGGKSWASVVASGPVDGRVRTVAKAKKVSWQDGAWNLGVETRVYIADEDHPEFEHVTREQGVSLTKYWDGVDEGGKTAFLKHVPYRAGEMRERTVVIDGEVLGDRIGFSQMTRLDGSELISTIFGRLVSKFFEGVPAPDDGGLVRTTKVGKLSPDFFKTGAGKEYVGREALRLKIEEALETIDAGRKFEMISEACCLEPRHTHNIVSFQEAYYSAVVEKMKKSKLRAEASVFVPKISSADGLRAFVLGSVGRSDLLENKTGVRFIATPIVGRGM